MFTKFVDGRENMFSRSKHYHLARPGPGNPYACFLILEMYVGQNLSEFRDFVGTLRVIKHD